MGGAIYPTALVALEMGYLQSKPARPPHAPRPRPSPPAPRPTGLADPLTQRKTQKLRVTLKISPCECRCPGCAWTQVSPGRYLTPMYRQTDTCVTGIAGPIAGHRYRRTDTWPIHGFFGVGIGRFLRAFGRPLRYTPIPDSARIHQNTVKYYKIHLGEYIPHIWGKSHQSPYLPLACV